MRRKNAKEVFVDMRTASREDMQMAFALHRERAIAELRQIQIDLESYNENYNPGEPIEFVFDFTDDLAELAIGEKVKP